MKYLIFFGGFFLVVPLGAFIAANSRRGRDIMFILMIVSTAFINQIDINFIERWWYHGTTRAIEISFIDFFSLMLLLSVMLSAGRERFRPYWPASLGLMIVFFVYATVNVLVSDPRLFGIFELTKMLRGLAAFLALAFFVRSERDVRILVTTAACILLYEGSLSVWQRYITGTFRVTGSLSHPSQLANYCCLLAPIVLAASFSNLSPRLRILCGAAWVAACVAVILTITRMGIATFMVTSAGLLLILVSKKPNTKTMGIVFLGCLLVGGLFIRGYDKMASRHRGMTTIEAQGEASAGRKVYYYKAFDLAMENPLGVGLNNWSYHVSAQEGTPYAGTDHGGEGPRAIMAHSAFALTLGELGWIGLIIFLALWCQWSWITGQYIIVRSTDLLPQVMLGCFFAIIAAGLSAITEHNFRTQFFYIVFNMLLGFAVAARRLHRHGNSTNSNHMHPH